MQPPKQRFGMVSHWDPTISAKLSELGAGVVRVPCNWENMEPSRGTFTWGCSDNAILGATAAGFQVLLTVECTPAWARTAGDCNTMPSDFGDFYDFVAAFVQRYSGYNAVLGIWNEPNLRNISTSDYIALFTHAADARNTHAPGFTLAAPETSHHAITSGNYYASVMAGVGPRMASQDVVTVHLYPDGPQMASYLDAVRSLERVSNDVWLSETGYPSTDVNTQATYYRDKMIEFETLGITRPWWTKIIFFLLYDGTDCCTESILYANFSNKPAFNTYKEWIADETGISAGTMGSNTYLFQDQQIISANGLYHLYYQADGNLVLYDQVWRPLWASNTNGRLPGRTAMQGDGNLVVYDAGGVARYWSGTQGHAGGYAVVQDNGGFFIFDIDGVPLKQIH